MNGFVAVTDSDWYEFLVRQPGPSDVNFWRPSSRSYRLKVGTPFFFKLKAPHNAIAGYGFLAGFSVLPDWLAWETFGEANGVPSLAVLRRSISRLRGGSAAQEAPQGEIGCGLIAEALFFGRGDWVAVPPSWHRSIQIGKTVDLATGEGLDLWQECLARNGRVREALRAADSAGRYGTPGLYMPRLGQGIFRIQVLDAYGRACAVTQEHSLPVLDAAHIKPYADGGEHRVENGLALRADLHRLFDRGYVTVDEEYRFVVSRRLKDEFENGRSYYGLQGHPIRLPADTLFHPDRAGMQWHRERVFQD